MASQAVQPLRIQKNNNNSTSSLPKPSPTKMAKALSEISPMGVRRNSPSFNQVAQKPAPGGGSSPFDASPESKSPRSFWKTRESASPSRFGGSENVPLHSQPSQTRRSSIERLQKASRVKNSNMFARASENGLDLDSSVMSDRSFASTRPLSGQAWISKSGSQNSSAQNSPSKGHRRSESTTQIPMLSPSKTAPSSSSPTKPHSSPLKSSPQKSSLSSNSRFAEATSFNPETVAWSDDEAGSGTPRGVLRHPKSVSFDVGPPQINEYEQITPDPSSVASGSREGSYDDDDEFDVDLSFERGSSEEHDDSFDHSLEDTEKTPVVLPEDWRFMSPDIANTELADTFDDPFDGYKQSSRPSSRREGSNGANDFLRRSLSVTSDGEPRPLPPLPTSQSAADNEPDVSSQEEKNNHSGSRHKVSPIPRPASISKADILKMQDSSMPLEERLRRLSMQNRESEHEKVDDDHDDISEEQTITLDRASVESEGHVNDQSAGAHGDQPPSQLPPSSEPSLRNLRSQLLDDNDIEKYANLDPDIPIPSREASSNYEDEQENINLRQRDHPTEEVADMYSMPGAQFDSQQSSPFDDDFIHESSVIRHDILIYEDEPSADESTLALDEEKAGRDSGEVLSGHNESLNKDNEPRADTTALTKAKDQEQSERKMSLPEFNHFSENDEFGFGLESYMTPSPPTEKNETLDTDESGGDKTSAETGSLHVDEHQPHFASQTVSQDIVEEAGTPESVIFNPRPEQDSPPTLEKDGNDATIPQSKSTVKAPGGKLKARASATPAELEALDGDEVHTSSEAPPAIPDDYRPQDVPKGKQPELKSHENLEKAPGRRQSMRMQLDLPLGSPSDDVDFGMDKEFDRLLEAQKVGMLPTPSLVSPEYRKENAVGAEYIPGKGYSDQKHEANVYPHRQRGYLMRQNTKVVVATNRNFSSEKPAGPSISGDTGKIAAPAPKPTTAPERETRSAGNSPRKPSGPTVTTEPWNGKVRRHSTRKSIVTPEKGVGGARASLGGQQNNALNPLTEDEQSILEPDAGAERGRFFVKVTGVKNLDLPLPRNERTYFQLTLDNGLHCVTTAWLELGRNAQIGQEFELTVFDELDFSLTLQTKLERPTSQASSVSQASSFESPKKKESKQFAFSRLLATPKKRREAERRQQEEQAELARQRQREIEAERANQPPSAWDLLHNLVGPDGSFARGIVSLDDYEEKAFGRPITTDVPCFNNWAVEDSFCSTKSKHGGVQRKPPYQVGNLTLQLLYIPKPKGVKDDDMPQSMSACVKQLKEAETNVTRQFEGHLSQQGGDCPFWRRRFFKLNGSVLTAYHEATRQRRANIRLAKATKLIDDRSALVQAETPSKGGKGRRRSAFATDTEGYMFVEEGFRICFANGDTIDFYADTREQKEEWMDNLSHVIGKDFSADKPTWMSAVLAYEKMKGTKGAPGQSAPPPPPRGAPQPKPQQHSPLKSNPASPVKKTKPMSTYDVAPPPIDKSPRHSLQTSPHKAKASGKPVPALASRPNGSANSGRRKAVRSMIF